MKRWFRCAECELLTTQLGLADRNLFNAVNLEMRRTQEAELKAVKFETLAEAYRLEIQRLERALDRSQPPGDGGFVTVMQKDSIEEPSVAPDAPDFAQRIDEVFGVGLSLEQIVERANKHRQAQLETLQMERAEIQEELQRIP